MEHFVQSISVRWYNACAYYAVALARGLEKNGFRVTVTGVPGTPAVKRAADYAIPVLGGEKTLKQSLMQKAMLVNRFRNFALENKVTLVNVHSGEDHLLWFLALRGTGIPLIRTSGNQIPPKIHLLSRFLMKRGTRGIIASCRIIREYYACGFGMESHSIPVIPGGVDTEYYSSSYPRGEIRKQAGVPEGAFLFGIVARFSPDKGHVHFFRAAGETAAMYPEAWFLVAGWNAQLTELDIREMARSAGIESQTVFIGRHPDPREIIASLDAGVITSIRSETVCRIAMECMSMGIPVIASDTNVIPEIIRDSETGLIVPAGDDMALTRAMARFLDDREKARALGDKGREIAIRDFSLESFATKTVAAYKSMTDNVS